jgi:hypothetical protein
MIPLRDANPSRTTPIVTFLLIALNSVMFLYEVSLPEARLERLVYTLGMVPERVAVFPSHPGVSFGDAFLPLFTSMFLHGGWLHLIGNMWFLWIFGDNIEDRLGHLRYLAFYMIAGMAAGLAQTFIQLHSNLPAIGASGAIAGVLGAYLVLFPGARMLTLIPAYFIFTVELPAYVLLAYWFIIQLFSGTASVVAGKAGGGGVAWWAHIGGFVAGAALIKLFQPKRSIAHVVRD